MADNDNADAMEKGQARRQTSDETTVSSVSDPLAQQSTFPSLHKSLEQQGTKPTIVEAII